MYLYEIYDIMELLIYNIKQLKGYMLLQNVTAKAKSQ
jgi:hypothetical protein